MVTDDNPHDVGAEETKQAAPSQPTQQDTEQRSPTPQHVTQGPSLTDEIQKPESMAWLKFNVAIFLAIGVGYAITFFLASAFVPNTAGTSTGFLGSSFAFGVGLFLAPLIAVVTGVKLGSEYQDRQNVVLANSFLGAAVGFLVMAIVMFVLVMAQAPAGAGGGGGDLGQLLGPLVGFAAGVGLTGMFATYVTRWAWG